MRLSGAGHALQYLLGVLPLPDSTWSMAVLRLSEHWREGQRGAAAATRENMLLASRWFGDRGESSKNAQICHSMFIADGSCCLFPAAVYFLS